MKTQLFARILGIAVVAAGALGATGASAQTRVDLDKSLLEIFNANYVQNERAFLDNAVDNQVDLTKLVYKGHGKQKALDIFFVNEGAKSRNALSLGVNGSDLRNLVFGDISSTESVFAEADGVLTLGQGVRYMPNELEPVAQIGSAIELFLKNKTRSTGTAQYEYSTTLSKNADGLQHVVGYNYNDGKDNWLILGFEDLYGQLGATGVDMNNRPFNNQNSDRDFNDTVIAIRGLSTQAVPEPGMMMALAGVTAGLLKLRKKGEEA